MIDVAIVGAGTAGLTAAIYTQRAGKQAVLFEATTFGGQIINTPDIENYPGIAHISGFDFANGLYKQAIELGAELKNEAVLAVEEQDGAFVVKTKKNSYDARTVILATGAKNRPLGLSEETELVGKGISYCATCDGMFFRNRVVAVNGGGNTALEDAAFLANYCSKVYLIHRRDQFRGDAKEVARLTEKENVEFVLNANVTKLLKNEKGRLCGIEVTDKFSGEVTTLEVEGLFIAIGQMPANEAFASLAELDPAGYISADERCTTRTAGLFTAGDCRTKEVRQLTTAASDGAVAALAACRYIDAQ